MRRLNLTRFNFSLAMYTNMSFNRERAWQLARHRLRRDPTPSRIVTYQTCCKCRVRPAKYVIRQYPVCGEYPRCETPGERIEKCLLHYDLKTCIPEYDPRWDFLYDDY